MNFQINTVDENGIPPLKGAGGCPGVSWTVPFNKTLPAGQGHEALLKLHPPRGGIFKGVVRAAGGGTEGNENQRFPL